jgi:hypothetical protein
MKKNLKAIAGSLLLAFSLVACGDSKEEAAQRSDLTNALVHNSVAQCETGPFHADNASYSVRLRSVLKGTSVGTLKTLQDNGVTICLDQRLASQSGDLFNNPIRGVFYSREEGLVAGIWDNGKSPDKTGWLDQNASTFGGVTLNKLAEKIRNNKVDAELMYAGTFYCGQGCVYTDWVKANAMDGSVEKNPTLNTPPTRDGGPKPAS